MTRNEFMWSLSNALAGLPQSEIKRITEYYDEIFNEAIEEGKSEEAVCASLGRPEDIAERVRAEMAFIRAEQQPSPKSMNAVLMVLFGMLALLGIPAAFALMSGMFALFVGAVAVVIGFGAAVIAMGAGGLALMIAGVAAFAGGGAWLGMALCGAALVLIGLALAGGVGTFRLTRVMMRGTVKLCRSVYNGVTGWLKGRKQA